MFLELRDVSLHYFGSQGETEALRSVSFGAKRGEFVGIVGPSGCGKSSILSLIAGLIQPTAGKIFVDGRPIAGPSRAVGYMMQQDCLFEWRTILENAVLGAEIQGADMAAAERRATDLLTRYGLGAFLQRYPRELSGGMRQRVALVRTLCIDPGIVLLDEPFSALDSQTRLILAGAVTEILRSEEKTVVLVTHDIGEAIEMTDRVLVLGRRPGHVKAEHHIDLGEERNASSLVTRTGRTFNEYFTRIWKDLEILPDD
jgi:NitT/TauT family transport system ATP-binding protein